MQYPSRVCADVSFDYALAYAYTKDDESWRTRVLKVELEYSALNSTLNLTDKL